MLITFTVCRGKLPYRIGGIVFVKAAEAFSSRSEKHRDRLYSRISHEYREFFVCFLTGPGREMGVLGLDQ